MMEGIPRDGTHTVKCGVIRVSVIDVRSVYPYDSCWDYKEGWD